MTWRNDFVTADELPDDASAAQKRARGKKFEEILHKMLEEARLHPRRNFRPAGEEIDGSFIHRDRIFLYEAKWTEATQAASSLYQFRGKVDGKLVGTIGVFFSMAGFSADTVGALVAGKNVNLILFDGDDVRAIAAGATTIREAIDFKVRTAVERGTPYISLSASSARRPSPSQKPQVADAVLVEGSFDVSIVNALIQRFDVLDTPEIVPAGGPLNIPRVLGSLLEQGYRPGKILVVVDGGDDAEGVRSSTSQQILDYDPSLGEVTVVSIDPNLEQALGVLPDGYVGGRLRVLRSSRNMLQAQVGQADLLERSKNPDVLRLLTSIGISEQQLRDSQ